MVTWGEVGQFVCADLAEAFLCGLYIRVEALCKLRGRMAKVEVRYGGRKFVPVVHCRCGDGGGSRERRNNGNDQLRRAYTLPSYTPPWPLQQRCTKLAVSTFLIRSGQSSPQISQRKASPALDRNNFLADRGIPLPRATSTGTTIVGCLFKDGIILGADTRATEGDIVADKNCEKVNDGLPPSCIEHNLPLRSITSLSLSDAVVPVPPRTPNSRRR